MDEKIINKVFNEDCLVGMDRIPDKSIDCIICDLPYGTTVCKWDIVIPFEPLWEQYRRIAKSNAAIILFGAEPFSSMLRLSNLDWFRYDIVWQKTKFSNFAMTGGQPGRIHEMISVFYQHQPTYNPQMQNGEPYKRCGRRVLVKDSISELMNQGFDSNIVNDGTRIPTTIVTFSNNKAPGESLHPTQKPVDLIRYLIRTYTNSGDIVLDNCMGSGTTAIAALREGRKYIGFELDKKYYEMTQQRIAEEKDYIELTDNKLF